MDANAFIAANLSITAFNVTLTIVMWVLMFAGVEPPDVRFGSFVAVMLLLNAAIWCGVYSFVS